jgi:hypothetical protein
MSNSQVDQVLDKLIQAKLIRTIPGAAETDSQIELAHESLLYGWPRFQLWLEEDQLTQYNRLRLAKDVEDWIAQGQPDILLWQKSILEEADSYDNLSETEIGFLAKSKNALRAVRIVEEKSAMQIEELSEQLRQVEAQRNALNSFLQSLEFSNRSYKNKYRKSLALAALLLISTVTTICLAIATTRDNTSPFIQETIESELNDH